MPKNKKTASYTSSGFPFPTYTLYEAHRPINLVKPPLQGSHSGSVGILCKYISRHSWCTENV